MNSNNKRQTQLYKMELDEKYLSRKLLEIAKNTQLIRSNLRKYKLKFKTKNKGKLFVHEKAFVKILRINTRIARLLVEKDLIPRMDIFGLNLYTVTDIEHFLRNNNSTHK